MKGKIDQNASRLDSLIKERFYLVDEVKVFKQQAEIIILPFKLSCIKLLPDQK